MRLWVIELLLLSELTKIHETICRTSLIEAISSYESTEPKGEFVLIIEGKSVTSS